MVPRLPLLSSLALLAVASGVAMAQVDPQIKPLEGRFETDAPLPTLPSLKLETLYNGTGLAQQTARSKGLQGRILWVDATANLDRVSTPAKVRAVVQKAKEVGFNTIVFDVKPIVGYTIYPSKLTPKLTKWKDQTLPLAFDPLAAMVGEAKAAGIDLYVSINTFAEGHRNVLTTPNGAELFGKPGPGYERKTDQTILYEPDPVLAPAYSDERIPISPVPNSIPKDGQSLALFNKASAPKTAPANSAGIVVDADGFILVEVRPGQWDFPGIPEGGGLILGVGEAAQRLRESTRKGGSVAIQARPKFVPIEERPEQQIPLMLNPHKASVQNRVLSFVDELMRNYDLKGIVFDDRLRYGGVNADFSPEAMSQFEAFVGQKLNWPQDVFEFTFNFDLTKGMRPGKYFDAWWAFRAQTMRDWVGRARETVQEARPGAHLGVYAGSWYGEYWRYGNNWASNKFRAGFTFLTDNYRKTGFAHHLDFLITGAYYPVATVEEAIRRNLPAGRTVEAAGQLTNRGVRDETWCYAGIELMKFKGNNDALMRALQAACGSTQGVMVFDLSHDIEQFWPVFKRAFSQRKTAPHSVRGALEDVRRRRVELDASGYVDPPVVIREGAAGTGL